jgi:hypothetical protein
MGAVPFHRTWFPDPWSKTIEAPASGAMSARQKSRSEPFSSSDLLSKALRYGSYFEYSTCTGAGVVGISLKAGIGRSGGAAESLVQHPQDEHRMAAALTEMARRRRVITGLV